MILIMMMMLYDNDDNDDDNDDEMEVIMMIMKVLCIVKILFIMVKILCWQSFASGVIATTQLITQQRVWGIQLTQCLCSPTNWTL